MNRALLGLAATMMIVANLFWASPSNASPTSNHEESKIVVGRARLPHRLVATIIGDQAAHATVRHAGSGGVFAVTVGSPLGGSRVVHIAPGLLVVKQADELAVLPMGAPP
jgi:hypothetical protein